MDLTLKTNKDSILFHLEKIVEISDGTGLTDAFMEKASGHIEAAAKKLKLSPVQTVLFAHFLDQADDRSITIFNIAQKFKCSKIRILQFSDDIEVLVKKRFIRCCRNSTENTYRIPVDVLKAVSNNKTYTLPKNENLSTGEIFVFIDGLFEEKSDNEITDSQLIEEMRDLFDRNRQNIFIRKMIDYNLHYLIDLRDSLVLCYICNEYVSNNVESVDIIDFNRFFENKFIKRH